MPEPKSSLLPGKGSGSESDLGELAALFAAQSGGSLPAELSAELALEIVLNEIVEQACLATGATGAAVLLQREGEMVCRASSGVNAPELGSRLGSESGLTAECIKTQQMQRCDDALDDPRADAEASRSLGVRSVMILPLLRNGAMAGVLEVFSAQPGAFGSRDQLTLETLAQSILKNLERASRPLIPAVRFAEPAPVVVSEPEPEPEPPLEPEEEVSAIHAAPTLHLIHPDASHFEGAVLQEDEPAPERLEQNPQPQASVLTYSLGAAVLVCALLLVALIGLRLGWRKASGERVQTSTPAITETQSADTAAPKQAAPAAGKAASSASPGPTSAKREIAPAAKPVGHTKEAPPPEGSLSVYENGKEIFHMPPAPQGSVNAQPAGSQKDVQSASVVQNAGIIELTPEAAAGSLLHRVEPEYPEAARQQGIQGAVVLDVRIGRDGTIQDVKPLSGNSLLADAAMAAVKQWRFKPRTVNGRTVEMQTRVTLNFRLPN